VAYEIPVHFRDRAVLSSRLLTKQDGRCPLCQGPILTADQPPQSPHEWERWWQHIVRRAINADYLTHHNAFEITFDGRLSGGRK
jgi:hypothetical protein